MTKHRARQIVPASPSRFGGYWAFHQTDVLAVDLALARAWATAGRVSILSATCQEPICTPPDMTMTLSPRFTELQSDSTSLGEFIDCTPSLLLGPQSIGSWQLALARSCSLARRAATTHMSMTLRSSPKEAALVASSS